MTPALLLELIQGLLAAAPQLLTLYDQLKSGTPVTAAQVQAALDQYVSARVALLADIAAEQSAGH